MNILVAATENSNFKDILIWIKLPNIQFIIQDGKHHPLGDYTHHLKYLHTQFDPGSESSSATQENYCLQKVKYQPWLTPQSRQLWQSQCNVNQYVSWDTYRRMIKGNSLLSVIYTDNVHWAYLLCFSCNLPTSVCCVLWCVDTNTTVITHTHTETSSTHQHSYGKDLL